MAVNYVKFQRGSQAAYDALLNAVPSRIDDNTLYFIYPEDNSTVGKLYLGTRLISGGDIVLSAATLNDLADVIAQNVAVNSFLVATEKEETNADGEVKKSIVWENKSLADVAALIKEAMGEIAAPAQVFQATKLEDDADDMAAIARVVNGKTLTAGDVAIVKHLIYGDKYEHTAYIHDGSAWVAMDGNYNAENVYFDEDITITMKVGNIDVTNGAGAIPAKGKNLKQVFEALYAKEDKVLTIDWPSVSFTLSSNVDAEVGTTFTRPSATLRITDIGSYEYGSLDSTGAEKATTATGVTFNKMKVAFGTNNAATTSMNEITAGKYGVNQTVAYTATATDIASNTVTDAAQSYSFCYITDHTASPYKPRTNLGNLIKTGSFNSNKTTLTGTETTDISGFADAVGALTAKTLNSSASFSVTGYRKWYTYVGDNMETIDSAWVRTKMTDKGKGKNVAYTAAAPLSLTVPQGTKRVVIALPTGKVGETTYGNYSARVTSCIDVDGMGLDIFAAGKFAQNTVAVNDASGSNPMDYIVYVLDNANGLSATTFKFAIA